MLFFVIILTIKTMININHQIFPNFKIISIDVNDTNTACEIEWKYDDTKFSSISEKYKDDQIDTGIYLSQFVVEDNDVDILDCLIQDIINFVLEKPQKLNKSKLIKLIESKKEDHQRKRNCTLTEIFDVNDLDHYNVWNFSIKRENKKMINFCDETVDEKYSSKYLELITKFIKGYKNFVNVEKPKIYLGIKNKKFCGEDQCSAMNFQVFENSDAKLCCIIISRGDDRGYADFLSFGFFDFSNDDNMHLFHGIEHGHPFIMTNDWSYGNSDGSGPDVKYPDFIKTKFLTKLKFAKELYCDFVNDRHH